MKWWLVYHMWKNWSMKNVWGINKNYEFSFGSLNSCIGELITFRKNRTHLSVFQCFLPWLRFEIKIYLSYWFINQTEERYETLQLSINKIHHFLLFNLWVMSFVLVFYLFKRNIWHAFIFYTWKRYHKCVQFKAKDYLVFTLT